MYSVTDFWRGVFVGVCVLPVGWFAYQMLLGLVAFIVDGPGIK